jgi:hypothetical protein
VLANDSDPDGDALTAIKETQPAHGTVALAADGTFTYTPDPGFEGADAFAYRAFDGTATSGLATVRIAVAPRANTAPTVADDAYSVLHDQTLNAGSVLANDGDAEGDPLTASLVGYPSQGYLSLATDGSFSYSPYSGFSGADTFTYRVSDGRTTSASAMVRLTVRPPNRAPWAADDYFDMMSGATLAGRDVLANDVDDDGDPLTAQIDRSPLNGQLALGADGRFAYRPDLHFVGTDVFSYTVADDSGARSAPAFVRIYVAGAVGPVPTPAPPPAATPTFGFPAVSSPPDPGSGHAAAGMRLRRAALRDGRLDLLADINESATGTATVSLRARGRTTVMRAPIVRGEIRLKRRVPRAQRSALTAIVKVAYGGSDRVMGDSIALWAAPRRAQLALTEARIQGGRLVTAGRLGHDVRGLVRVRLSYRTLTGGIATYENSVLVRQRPAWYLQVALPPRVAATGGRLLVQFDGDSKRRIRGEQLVRQVGPG